jgi:hypothetical protein
LNRYSASKVKTFDTCRLKYKKYYIDKIRPPRPENDDTNFGSLIHEMAEVYDGDNKKEVVSIVKKFPLGIKYKQLILPTLKNLIYFIDKHNEQYKNRETIREMELEFKKEDDEKPWLYGKVDRLIFGEDSILYIDYKTSASTNKDRHLFQMRFYNLMIHWVYPDYSPSKIKCIIYYPRIDDSDKFMFSDKEIQIFDKHLRDKINEIETCNDWFATPGYHCKWCEYNETPHCPVTYMKRSKR